ncbi:MAG: hypothetical protein ACREU9_11460 [Gammaproteobacteria bacterium]
MPFCLDPGLGARPGQRLGVLRTFGRRPFVKMVHNGIEYGLMQAYAEGFSLLAAKQDLELPLAEIAQAWCHGTVIRSWLLELTAAVLEDNASLDTVAAQVADSGEGRWTAQEAIDLGIPIPVISAALMARFSSQGGDDFGARVLATLRSSLRKGDYSSRFARSSARGCVYRFNMFKVL